MVLRPGGKYWESSCRCVRTASSPVHGAVHVQQIQEDRDRAAESICSSVGLGFLFGSTPHKANSRAF